MITPPELRYATTPDGLRIAYGTIGDGPVDIVSVPGLTTQFDLMWDIPGYAAFYGRLGRFARITLFDKRGTGLSDRGGRHPTLDEQAFDVETVLDAIGAERATLFGWSEGAAISALLAASRPDRVERLVLYGGTACVLERPGYAAGLSPEYYERLGVAAIRSWGSPDPATARLLYPSHADDLEYHRLSTRAYRAASTAHELASAVAFVRDLDYRHVLPAIHVPTLVVHRRDELFVPVAMGRYLAENIPGARYVELPGRDHPPWSGDHRLLADTVEEFVTGHLAPAPSERILATIMFTDIVGSTERLARVGDTAWRDLLDRHDVVIADTVGVHGGVVVKSTGDGCLARFELPGRAIACARQLTKRADGLGLELRIGLHTGEVEAVGEDLRGMAVHVAARVAAEAPPGGVVVTSTVKDLVAGGAYAFDEPQERQLKGIPDRWRLYGVRAG